MLTSQRSISGFLRDNSRPVFTVAFMDDKEHGGNPEAVCPKYQKRPRYLCFYFLKVGQKSLPHCIVTHVGPLQDKEQKSSTQNSTWTRHIKVISLKE